MTNKACLVSLLCLTSISFATNVTQINRYATVMNKPLPAQINPLEAVQQIHFPPEVQTIGQAVEWWLRYSGFRLASSEKQIESLKATLQQPLPQIDRNLGPLTVTNGLEVLVGQSVFALVQDPLLREVNFKMRKP